MGGSEGPCLGDGYGWLLKNNQGEEGGREGGCVWCGGGGGRRGRQVHEVNCPQRLGARRWKPEAQLLFGFVCASLSAGEDVNRNGYGLKRAGRGVVGVDVNSAALVKPPPPGENAVPSFIFIFILLKRRLMQGRKKS